MKKSFRRCILALVILFFVLRIPGLAAPYGPKNKITVFDRLYESDLVIYGKIIQKMKSKNQGDLTEVEVYDNIKGGKWGKGDYFYINSIVDQPNKSIGVIYLFKSYKKDKEFFEFNAFYKDKNKDMYEYTLKVKEFMDKDDTQGRLSWLYSQVDNENSLIAWDAFAQLGMAPYSQLKKAAPSINKESLRYLITAPGVKDNRKSFYAFLLGLAGDPNDASLIKRLIENDPYRKSQIVYGAMLAYGLLLRDHPEYYYEQMQKGPDNIRKAVLEAIKNMMLYERPQDPQNLLKPLYWALKRGSRGVTLKAVKASAKMRITGPVKYMRNIYFGRFSNYREGKIAIINYLKFVRRKIPDAVRLLNDIKTKETDPEVKRRI